MSCRFCKFRRISTRSLLKVSIVVPLSECWAGFGQDFSSGIFEVALAVCGLCVTTPGLWLSGPTRERLGSHSSKVRSPSTPRVCPRDRTELWCVQKASSRFLEIRASARAGTPAQRSGHARNRDAGPRQDVAASLWGMSSANRRRVRFSPTHPIPFAVRGAVPPQRAPT